MIATHEGLITAVTPLSSTANEITVTFTEPFECLPGSFVNFFMNVDGTEVRRAFSAIQTDSNANALTLSIRLTPQGIMTPEFWKEDIVGRTVRVMGPLGRNTADKLSHPTVHLFGYGIGAGVIKAIVEYTLSNPIIQRMTITTGSRSENDIIYKNYFDEVAAKYPHVTTRYVISNPKETTYPYKGYIQDYIDDINFNNSDIYMCGMEIACATLTEKIKSKEPNNASFFIEAFH